MTTVVSADLGKNNAPEDVVSDEYQKEMQGDSILEDAIEEPIINPEKSGTIKHIRSNNGLAEQPILLDGQKIFQRKKEKVIEHLEKIKEANLGSRGFIDRNKNRSNWKREPVKKNGLLRKSAIQILKLRGIKEADKIVETIELDAGALDYARLIISKQVLRGKAIEANNLDRVYEGVLRLRQIGYEVYQEDYFNPKVLGVLDEMASIPEENFRNVSEQLNPYMFLTTSDNVVNQGEIVSDLQTIVDIFKKGGLDKTQKDILDQQLQLDLMRHSIARTVVLQQENGNISESDYQHEDYRHIDYILIHTPNSDLMDQLITLGIESYHTQLADGEDSNGVGISAGFTKFAGIYRSNGYLKTASELIKHGFRGAGLFMDSIGKLNTSEDMAGELVKASEVLLDKDRLEWLSTLVELSGESDLNYEFISFYEQLLKNKESLSNLLNIIAALPESIDVNFSTLLKSYIADRSYQGLTISGITKHLIDIMSPKRAHLQSDDPFLETIFSIYGQERHNEGFSDLNEEKTERLLRLLSALSVNKSELLLWTNDHTHSLEPSVIHAMLSGILPLNDEDMNYWFSRNYFSNMSDQDIDKFLVHFNRFDLRNKTILIDQSYYRNSRELIRDSQTLSPETKNVILGLYDFVNYPQVFEVLIQDTAKAARWFHEGLVTPEFFTDISQTDIPTWAWLNILDQQHQVIQTFPEKERDYWNLIRQVKNYSIELATLTIKAGVDYEDYFKQGRVTDSFLDLATKSNISTNEIAHIMYISNEGPIYASEESKAYWQFFKDSDNRIRPFLIDNKSNFSQLYSEGRPTPHFFNKAIEFGVNAVSYWRMVTDDVIQSFPENEREFWSFFKDRPPQLANFIVSNKIDFSKLITNGLPNATFFERAYKSRVASEPLLEMLSREVLENMDTADRTFWTVIRDANVDKRMYIVENYTPSDFAAKFCDKDTLLFDNDHFDTEFTDTQLMKPENVNSWETIRLILERIGQMESSEARAMAYLRIAEALTVNTGQRTEVETLIEVRQNMAHLYRSNMSQKELRCWNLLRRQMPFTTDERLRTEMRDQASDVVEPIDRQNLSWVHQAIHNYVRAQNPEYMRALVDWVNKGDEDSRKHLEKLSMLYTQESKPPDSFYEDNVRLRLRDHIDELRKMANLTDNYFKLNLDTAFPILEQLGRGGLSEETMTYLKKVCSGLTKNKNSEQYQEEVYEYLISIPNIRQEILELTRNNTFMTEKANLLVLDAIISETYEKLFSEYTTNIIEPILLDKQMNTETAEKCLLLLRSVIICGQLNGDIAGFDKVPEQLLASLNSREMGALRLLLEKDVYDSNKDWQSFSSYAQNEMIQMLTRMGMNEADAKAQAIMTDFVVYEKQTYKFVLEPFLKLFMENSDDIEKNLKLESVYGRPLEGDNSGNDKVDEFLQNLASKYKIPNDIQNAHRFLTDLTHLPFFQADGLCKALVAGYLDDKRNRQPFKFKANGDTIQLYPFSLYAANGVVMLLNGEIVEDPLTKIKEIYKKELVPAVLNSLKEGD